MSAKPIVPPKPRTLGDLRGSGLGSPSSLVSPDSSSPSSSRDPVISSPFGSSVQHEPQFFASSVNARRAFFSELQCNSSDKPKPTTKNHGPPRRTSLPESAVHAVKISKKPWDDLATKTELKLNDITRFSEDGKCPDRTEGRNVAETKRKLLNRTLIQHSQHDQSNGMSTVPDKDGTNDRLSHELSAQLFQQEDNVLTNGGGNMIDGQVSDENGIPVASALDVGGNRLGDNSKRNQDFSGSADNLVRDDTSSSDSESSRTMQKPGLVSSSGSFSISKAQKIAAEIVSSEHDYLQSLKLLLVEFPTAVQGSIPPEEITFLLKGLPEIEKFSEQFLADLQSHLDAYSETQKIAVVFLRKGKFLTLYVHYVKEFEKMIDTYRALLRKYPVFAEMVSKFEKSAACKMLPLVEYFHKPVQRLPRYPLLLGTYLRALDEGHPDREQTKQALDLVSDVTAKANTSLAAVERVSRLLWYQARTVGYTFLKPNRTFIREGTLTKLSRKTTHNRTVLLCSDAIITGEFESVTGKFSVNAEYSLTDIKVEKLDEEYFDPDLEFGIFSTRKSFVFQASSTEERKSWMNAIERAVEELHKLPIMNGSGSHFLVKQNYPEPACERRKKSGNTFPIGFALQPDTICILLWSDLTTKPAYGPCTGKAFLIFLALARKLGKLSFAPIWIPDYRVKACQICKKAFNMFRRYHHCRTCGYAVCSSCSPHEIGIDYKENRPKRVCTKCFAVSKQEDFVVVS